MFSSSSHYNGERHRTFMLITLTAVLASFAMSRQHASPSPISLRGRVVAWWSPNLAIFCCHCASDRRGFLIFVPGTALFYRLFSLPRLTTLALMTLALRYGAV
jgi:hypothetical protein